MKHIKLDTFCLLLSRFLHLNSCWRSTCIFYGVALVPHHQAPLSIEALNSTQFFVLLGSSHIIISCVIRQPSSKWSSGNICISFAYFIAMTSGSHILESYPRTLFTMSPFGYVFFIDFKQLTISVNWKNIYSIDSSFSILNNQYWCVKRLLFSPWLCLCPMCKF